MRVGILGVVGADEFVSARGRFLCGGDDGAEDADDDEECRGAEDIFEGGLAFMECGAAFHISVVYGRRGGRG